MFEIPSPVISTFSEQSTRKCGSADRGVIGKKFTDLYGDESFHHGHHCERHYVEHEGRGGQYVEPGEI
jgi:hypothetical protein